MEASCKIVARHRAPSAGPTRSRPLRPAHGVVRGCSPARMAAETARDRIIEALKALPRDATYEDVIERIVFLAKIEEGLAELDRGDGVPHEAAGRRLHR